MNEAKEMTQDEKNARALTIAGCGLLGALMVAILVSAVRTGIDGNQPSAATITVS